MKLALVGVSLGVVGVIVPSSADTPLVPPLTAPKATTKTAPVTSLAQNGVAAAPSGVVRSQCFPVEQLGPTLRAKAEATLLKAMDGEALYTIVGGVKPMSSGWLSLQEDLDNPAPQKLDEWRQILASLRCGDEISAHLSAFAQIYGRKRPLQGTFFNHAALRSMLQTRATFWNQYAISPRSEPLEVLMATEYAPMFDRFRGYGYLFGYPTRAVNFFVEAAQTQEADPQKKLVPRDFFSIPTVAGDEHRFVYAVPKAATPDREDMALRQKCAPILKEYKRRRALYIGTGKRGIVTLLRDWFDNGQGRCSPRFARF